MRAAGATAVAKGFVNGLSHFATGVNPLAVADNDDEEIDQSPEPLKPLPKAKAQASSYWGGSSGSQEKSKPYPFPAQPFVDVRPFNGGVFDVSSEEEARPAAAAAAAPLRPPSRLVSKKDTQHAKDTIAAMGNLPPKRNGRR